MRTVNQTSDPKGLPSKLAYPEHSYTQTMINNGAMDNGPMEYIIHSGQEIRSPQRPLLTETREQNYPTRSIISPPIATRKGGNIDRSTSETARALVVNNNEYTLEVASPSRFRFVVDEQRVQLEWNVWEEQSLRQRQEFKSRIHNLQLKTAQILARVAFENLERNRSLEQCFLKEHVFGPLNLLVDRMALLQDDYRFDNTMSSHESSPRSKDEAMSCSSTSSCINQVGSVRRWRNLERRLSVLDLHMTRSMHEHLPLERRQQLTGLFVELLDLIKKGQQQRLEAAKAEGNLARRMEDIAGRVLCAPYQEERAIRSTAIQLATESLERPEKLGLQEAQGLSQQIQELRLELARLRQERQTQDQLIHESIESKAQSMQRSLLEAVSDPES